MDHLIHQRGLYPLVQTTKRTPSNLKREEWNRQFAWVDWLKARVRIDNDNALAIRAGLNNNYVYRARNRGTVMNPVKVKQIASHFGVPGPDHYLSTETQRGFGEEAIPYDNRQNTVDDITRQMIEIALRNRPNAAPWTLRTSAIEGVGYLPGDILIADATVQPRAQDVVIAQLYGETGAETIFRVYEPPYLMAVTSDATLRKPHEINDHSVIVRATVTQMFRPRRP